jgi:glycosyltransferase involved in cell wall biosynthesis
LTRQRETDKDVVVRLSVILSTYNSPDWLEKAIWGYAAQSHRNFELLVADDGSTEETRRRIDYLRRDTGLAIRHIWHEDRGFRKCTILNRAIEAAACDYLVFSDGDCIPRWDFLATHVHLAQLGRFLSGGLFRLPLDVSRRITKDDIAMGRATDPCWLRGQGVPWSLKLLKLQCTATLAACCDRLTTTRATWNGHNASGWKADLLAVNGFDERMEWGAEDRELGERLIHLGVRPRQIRHRAVCVHLDHDRGYVRAEAVAKNRQIWNETKRTRATWTPYGLRKEDIARPRAA